MSAIPAIELDRLRDAIRSRACVALHFHPDRPQADGRTALEGLLASGIYKSQFETGTSSGSVSATPGGDRDRWEHDLFGAAYHAQGVAPAERPKYGALDLLGHGDGPSPRFGSAYLVLQPHVSARSTFTWLDSFRLPAERGTVDALDDVLAALLAECFEREVALGLSGVRPPQLLESIHRRLCALPARTGSSPSRNLDHYIEAQVHGTVSLARDASTLVMDASFRGTDVDALADKLAARYALERAWAPGFALGVEDVPSDFRGEAMPSLARRIARGDVVDAATLGQAAQSLHAEPAAWADRGDPAAVLQELKLLWHCLVRYGHPVDRPS